MLGGEKYFLCTKYAKMDNINERSSARKVYPTISPEVRPVDGSYKKNMFHYVE